MAKSPKIGHNMAQETRIFREVSEGVHPRLSVKVAPYLPVKDLKYQGSEQLPVVIYAGELIALDQWNQLVPANKGVLTSGGLEYTVTDVTWETPLLSTTSEYGVGATATAGATADLPANNAIGYAYTDYYAETNFLNFKPQQDVKTISTDWLVQYPIITSNQQQVAQGALIVPDEALPGAWRPVTAADYADAATTLITQNNVVGRVMKIEKITDHMNKQDLIVTAPGLNIHGGFEAPGGAGIPNHLSTAASYTRTLDNVAGGSATSQYTATILVRI